MTNTTMPDRCDRRGGDPTTRNDGGVPVIECADCGTSSVWGRTGPRRRGVADRRGAGEDGDLMQLVALRRAEADAPDGTVAADRLLLETAAATLEVTATDGRIEIRKPDDEAAERGG